MPSAVSSTTTRPLWLERIRETWSALQAKSLDKSEAVTAPYCRCRYLQSDTRRSSSPGGRRPPIRHRRQSQQRVARLAWRPTARVSSSNRPCHTIVGSSGDGASQGYFGRSQSATGAAICLSRRRTRQNRCDRCRYAGPHGRTSAFAGSTDYRRSYRRHEGASHWPLALINDRNAAKYREHASRSPLLKRHAAQRLAQIDR